MTIRCLLLWLLGPAFVAANVALADTAVEVEPVSLLDDGQIAACGLAAKAHAAGGAPVSVGILVLRDGERTVFELSGRSAELHSTPKDLTFRTASHDSAALFPTAQPHSGGGIATRSALDGFAGASFIQEAMVTGGSFSVTFAEGPPLTFDLPRPMPHRVRQAYLACAGDLFRPEPD